MSPAHPLPSDPTPLPTRTVVLPPAIMAVCVGVAVVAVGSAARMPVALCGAVAVVVVGVMAVYAARRELMVGDLRRLLADQEAQTVRIAEEVLSDAIDRLRQGETVDEVLDTHGRRARPGLALHPAQLSMLRRVLDAVKAEEDLRDSAQRAFVNIARRVQAIVHQQFRDLREMEERHGAEPRVFGDLLQLDHGTALIGRLADSIAVLGGSRPGRQWQQNVPLFSVLRGAISRIADYQRVDLHPVPEVAVVGPAVEPLIHALAEVLDNATRYSPPHTRVHLSATEIPAGIAIEVEDSGVGLSDDARLRAERVFSQVSAGLDLADLGETPRLGLSVVGRLAQANGFRVALRPSAYAGVRAVVVLPSQMVTTAPIPTTAQAATAAIPGVIGAALPPNRPAPTAAPKQEPEINGIGLPQRHRRTPNAVLLDDAEIRTAPLTDDPQAAPTAPTAPTATTTVPTAQPVTAPAPTAPLVAARPAAPTIPPQAQPPETIPGPDWVSGVPAAPEEDQPAPPGMWLAAFQNAVSGSPADPPDTLEPERPSSDEGDWQ
jgi:signal transduction histidine kinase